mgnify:CR=1 FL=1
MAEHAKLSASSAERWINCPGSVHMASLFPENSSAAAEEGTLAHELAALEISRRSQGLSKAEYDVLIGPLNKQIDGFYTQHTDLGGSFEIMAQMIEPYVDYVDATYQEIRKEDPAAVILTEQRVDFSDIVPQGFGTSDVVIIGADHVVVIDLKYGKGVPISAQNNPQIRLYAIGAINLFDLMYEFHRVKMVIYQPRLDSVTEEELTVFHLENWAKGVVKPAADKALSDDPPYHVGEWCASHFCPGAGACKARADYVLALERHSGKDPALLTDGELGDALERAEVLQKWAKSLNSYALGEIQSGHPIPGWKIVEGRSQRYYTDLDKVADAAISAGYPEALIYSRSLIGITDMEKLMGRKKFKEILGPLVDKPQGAPKLAPESDKRPAFNPAAADFAD